MTIANYHLLPRHTSLTMASGVLNVELICSAQGPENARSLPAYHAFTGADNNERFSRIGKLTWFQKYLSASNTVVAAFTSLCNDDMLQEKDFTELSSVVCTAYCPCGIDIQDIPELKWYLGLG